MTDIEKTRESINNIAACLLDTLEQLESCRTDLNNVIEFINSAEIEQNDFIHNAHNIME